MTSKIRSLFLSSTIITVLLFSALGPTTVYADDGTTADTPTAETGSGEDTSEEATKVPEATATAEPEDGMATEVPATDTVEATATPEATATGEPVAPAEDSAPADPQPTDPPAVTTVEETAPPVKISILEQVPENTTVSVLGANGQPQPLATQDSANAIEVTSDPVWCPATQTTPTPGANGCTASFTSFDALLTELAGNPLYQQAGTIYVQQNAYAGGESIIDFNSYDLSNIQNFDLTVTGGWNTTNNTVDPTNSSTFTAPIIIGSNTNPWGGSLTINNISITNTNGTGLTVYSQNNITLSNVQVSNSVTGSGAELDAGGDVNISNSNFERNRRAGAIIRAGGDVAIANTSLSNSGTNRLQTTGADITSAGSVSLFDVLANGNREVGVNIVADGRVSIGATAIGGSSFSGTTGLTTTTCPGQVGTFCGYVLKLWPQIVTLHLLGGFSTLSLLWLLLLRLSNRPWPQPGVPLRYWQELKPLAFFGLILVICQITLGGWTSTNYAALACPDLPTCQGRWWPTMDFGSGFNFSQEIGPNYLGGQLDGVARVAIHMTHRFGAIVVALYLLFLISRLKKYSGGRHMRSMANILLGLLVLQIGLGLSNVYWSLPLPIAVAHNAGGALLLLAMITLNYRLRLSTSPW